MVTASARTARTGARPPDGRRKNAATATATSATSPFERRVRPPVSQPPKNQPATQEPASHPPRNRSAAQEPAEQLRGAGLAAGARLPPVGPAHRVQAGVHSQPPQRLGLPPRRVVVHPGQPPEVAAGAQDQV